MLIKNVKAIDVHSHFGEYIDPRSKIINKRVSADIDFVISCQEKANAEFIVVSPMESFAPPDVCDPMKANDKASEIADIIGKPLFFIAY